MRSLRCSAAPSIWATCAPNLSPRAPSVTPPDLGWIGIWLLVVAVVAIIVEAGLAGLWTVRIARRSKVLSERLAAEQARVQADVERLQAALAEMAILWQPYGRLLRWVQHPLAIALVQSFVRRRAAGR